MLVLDNQKRMKNDMSWGRRLYLSSRARLHEIGYYTVLKL